MFHKNAAHSLRSSFTSPSVSNTVTEAAGHSRATINANGPRLVSPGQTQTRNNNALPDLVSIASRRCSSFFAEAAVLVLVFGLLDFFLQRGHMELGWVAGALVISVALLAASVATDFTARRWLGAHP